MTLLQRILLFILLPIIAVLSYPPDLLSESGALIAVAVGFFVLIGILLWRGRSLALTFAIFLQGMNVIVRLMLFFSHAVPQPEQPDVPFAIAMILGLALSAYLMLRLDRNDIRSTMTV